MTAIPTTTVIATCPVCHQESRRFSAKHVVFERGEFGVVTLHEKCWEKVAQRQSEDA